MSNISYFSRRSVNRRTRNFWRYHHLNPDTSLIIVDDAHRREDLGALLEYAHRSDHCKLILSARPQGLASLRSQLTQSGFDTRDIVSIDDVAELDSKNVERLAASILGPKFKRFVKQLVAVSKDCPLVTVIGGTLLAEESIDPSLLTNSETFRNEALNRFQDISIGHISDQVNPDTCRAILRLISAIGPFRVNNRPTIDAAANFVGIQAPELLRICGILEELGVLSRIGNLLRITPDVLSDHILDSACVSKAGPTGYADEVFETFSSLCPESVLRNLGELDWRISHRNSPPLTPLLAPPMSQSDRFEPNKSGSIINALAAELIQHQKTSYKLRHFFPPSSSVKSTFCLSNFRQHISAYRI